MTRKIAEKYSQLILPLAVLILYSSCSQVPRTYQPHGQPMLAHKIKKVIDNSGLATNVGIKIMSAESGKTLYQLNSDHLVKPASNNKTYTAAAAFHYLGADYRFHTEVWGDAKPVNGHLNNLVLKAGGDPDFSLTSLDSLAKIVAELVVSVDQIIIDNSRLDSVRLGEGWMWDEGSWWYAAQVDAMSLNENCIDFDISPGIAEAPAQLLITPDTEYISINNQALTVTDTTDMSDFEITRRWWEPSNVFDVTGDILFDDDRDTLYRNIHAPALFTGQVFKEMLISYGVETASDIKIGQLPDSTNLIADHISEPLSVVIKHFLKDSYNLSGELLVKTIGLETTGNQGNWQNGLLAVKSFLQDEVGIDTTRIRMVDGSGVSHYNHTCPDQLAQLLYYVYTKSDFRSEYQDALPISGVDGTLENRMQNELVQGKILAKTGTLSGASSLSGYAFSQRGETLIFSIMVNGYVGSSGPYRRLQDKICTILATY